MKRYFFVTFITFCFLSACKSSPDKIQEVDFQVININKDISEEESINQFIAPYRQRVEEEMKTVLAYNPTDLIKQKNVLSASIGNFMADACYEIADPIFFNRTGQHIDFVLLNWGGIRSDLPKGNITVRSAYELMPFENKLMILEMKGLFLADFAKYMAENKKPHPISKQILIAINENSQIQDFSIHGEQINPQKTYYIATSDYLMNGGDGMTFLQNAQKTHETDYLIRNILIDYFKKIDTLHASKDKRFSVIK